MVYANEETLAARPEQFEIVDVPRDTRLLRVIGLVTVLVVLGLAVTTFIRGDLLYAFILVVAAVLGGLLFWNVSSSNARVWQLRDGRRLEAWREGLSDDPDETWARLATGDPTRYTPLQLTGTQNARSNLDLFWPTDERVTYIVITSLWGRPREVSEIIELRDAQHDAVQEAKARFFRAD